MGMEQSAFWDAFGHERASACSRALRASLERVLPLLCIANGDKKTASQVELCYPIF